MALSDVVTQRADAVTLIVRLLLAWLAWQTVKTLYQGFRIRMKFRRMQCEGIVIPAGHSLLLGHMPLFAKISRLHPKDTTNNYRTRELVLNWPLYFPGAPACPPVIYLDVWPLNSEPMALINDPALCQAVTAGRFPPRHDLVKSLARVLGGTRQLFEWDGARHRLWRARLNPGFSARNLQAHVARGRLVDEVCTFAERIRASCGADGGWGDVFPLFPRAIDLTFDIICGAVLDFSPGEQKKGPTELQTNLRILGQNHFFLKSLKNLPRRLSPFANWEFYQCHRALRRILLPHIRSNVPSEGPGPKNSSRPKTVVDMAMKEMETESKPAAPGSETPSEDFVDDVIGLTKQFIFAGHDTTAIALSFAFHFVQKHPQALEKMREEHDAVFGTDAAAAPSLLRQSPHLLGSLPYTTAVVKETLRLVPVAAAARQSPPNFVLRDPETARIWPTEGFILVTGVATLQFHPEIWPRPTEFLPERWIAGEGDALYSGPNSKYAWRPFEWGPMSCIGQELALMELKMALLFVVRELEFETALEEWDRLRGKDTKDRPTVYGDPVYQTAVGLGPPTEGLPMRGKGRLLQVESVVQRAP